MKNARPTIGKTSAPEQGNLKAPASFLGTDNPRHLRVIQAVWVRPIPREHLDVIAGCSNGPELVAELRRRGLEMPCSRTRKQDRDLFDCWPGVYHLTQRDRQKLAAWKRTRAAGRGQA
ncbi:MAG: hypothetical protein QFE16_01325 [Pseudomonadota bacterium]|nr:hypothetical protein [Pseudomonadota bacterium]